VHLSRKNTIVIYEILEHSVYYDIFLLLLSYLYILKYALSHMPHVWLFLVLELRQIKFLLKSRITLY